MADRDGRGLERLYLQDRDPEVLLRLLRSEDRAPDLEVIALERSRARTNLLDVLRHWSLRVMVPFRPDDVHLNGMLLLELRDYVVGPALPQVTWTNGDSRYVVFAPHCAPQPGDRLVVAALEEDREPRAVGTCWDPIGNWSWIGWSAPIDEDA